MAKGKPTKKAADTAWTRWLKAVRAVYGLEQGDLAGYIGRSRSAVAMYETGTPIPADVVAAIVTNFENAPRPPSNNEVEIAGMVIGDDRVSTIRYAGVVPCSGQWGDPLMSDELRPIDPDFVGKNRFLCKIAGMSCWPFLQPGDMSVWETDDDPDQGCIVLAQRLDDGACTVKELGYDDARGRYVLVPLNPDHEAPPDDEGWRAIARLVGLIDMNNGPKRTWLWERGLRKEHLDNRVKSS